MKNNIIKNKIIITNNKIIIFDEKNNPIYFYKDKNKENFEEIKENINNNNINYINNLIDNHNKKKKEIKKFLENSLKLNKNLFYKEGNIYYKNEIIDNSLTKKIIKMIEKKQKNLNNIVKFLDNLLQNPSKNAIKELYGFLEYGNLPITKDGYFLAYKKVTSDFKDIYTHTFDNSVGSTCKMKRNLVDNNKNITCSKGLHFCSKEYLKHFGVSNSNIVVILKINPKDVVSIPVDYNNTKGRCCKYKVINTYTIDLPEILTNDEYDEIDEFE